MSDVNAQQTDKKAETAVAVMGTPPRGMTRTITHIDDMGLHESGDRHILKERIQLFSGRLKEAQAALASATPHSNHEKKARAEIAKCKKKLIRLQKDLKSTK